MAEQLDPLRVVVRDDPGEIEHRRAGLEESAVPGSRRAGTGRRAGGAHARDRVFFGTLTDLECEITVTDTETGSQRVCRKPAFELTGGADTAAFTG